MKGQAVSLGEQHQRKEARRKEKVMPKPNPREERDQEPLVTQRVIIYLSATGRPGSDGPQNELSIDQQRALCRSAAAELHAEVVGEFVDKRLSLPERPGLRQALAFADEQELDYLIVSSLDRLAWNVNEAFDISWRLVRTGAIAIPADREYKFPWTVASLSRA
jgi:hypothetical protein